MSLIQYPQNNLLDTATHNSDSKDQHRLNVLLLEIEGKY